GEDADVLIARLDIATESEAVAFFRDEADRVARQQRGEQTFEVVYIRGTFLRGPSGGSHAAGEQDGEGFAFLVLRLATARIAENAAHFEETQGFRLLAHIARGGGDETRHDART